MNTLHTITFWLTPIAFGWLILLSGIRLTSTSGYRVFPSREMLAVIVLASITIGLPRIDSTISTTTSGYVDIGLSHIEHGIDRIGREFGPLRITGVQPDPESPNLWGVSFSDPIICTGGRLALATKDLVISNLTQDCTGEPRTVLNFRFNKNLKPGTQITNFAMTRDSHIEGLDGEALSTYRFDPVVVQER